MALDAFYVLLYAQVALMYAAMIFTSRSAWLIRRSVPLRMLFTITGAATIIGVAGYFLISQLRQHESNVGSPSWWLLLGLAGVGALLGLFIRRSAESLLDELDDESWRQRTASLASQEERQSDKVINVITDMGLALNEAIQRREQLAEASSVEVVLAVSRGNPNDSGAKGAQASHLELTVSNHGHYAITGIQAAAVHALGVAGFTEPRREQRLDAYKPNAGYAEPVPGAHPDWLPPWDARLVFTADLPDSPKNEKEDLAIYPVVRWTDRWGTGWQHRRGKLLRADSPDGLRLAWDGSGPVEPPPPPPPP